jgi:chondroitin 4-sulfotransferase 11
MTVIDKKEKYLFIHIPKNAGTSITHALHGKTPHEVSSQNGLNKHSDFLKVHALFEVYGLKKYFKFAVLRNPFDRMVSIFHYKIDGLEKKIKYGKIKNGDPETIDRCEYILHDVMYDFNKWLMFPEEREPLLYDERFGASQLSFLKNHKGKIGVDYIMKFENLEEDWKYVMSKIDKAKPLPHMNQTDHKHYRDIYDFDSEEYIREVCKEEIEHFKYEF